MDPKLAAVLLGFTVGICAQNQIPKSQVPCDCDELRICSSSKRLDHQEQEEKCFSDCIQKNLQNSANVKKCFAEKQTAIEALMEQMDDCVFDPTNGICGESRFRRQIFSGGRPNSESDRANFGSKFATNSESDRTDFGASGWPNSRSDLRNFGARGRPNSRCDRTNFGSFGSGGRNRGKKVQVPEDPQPFECLRICSEQNRPQPTGRIRQRGKRHGRFGGRHSGGRGRNEGFVMPGLNECAKNLKCDVANGAIRDASQFCKPAASRSDRDQQNEIEQSFRLCIQTVFGSNETARPWQRSTISPGHPEGRFGRGPGTNGNGVR